MSNTIVVGLGYGDEGKGTTTDFVCRQSGAHTVVRFNGGAQAAHAVVLPDGTTHRFAQFGAGTFAGARTFLSRLVCVDPYRMMDEANALLPYGGPDPCSVVYVDRECLLTTPYHAILNRAAEMARGQGRHGSCGVGVGETMRYQIDHAGDAPRVHDIGSWGLLRKLDLLYRLARDAVTEPDQVIRPREVADAYVQWADRVNVVDRYFIEDDGRKDGWVFEGAQGVLLDEWRGFHPYTTWSTCTPTNALYLCAEADLDVDVLGVTRTYLTRHGPGPFVTEMADVLFARPETTNVYERWMGAFRAGYLDLVALEYAVACCERVDGLMVTHADRALSRVCDRYKDGTREVLQLRASEDPDLDYQERLTAFVGRATPGYRDVVADDVPEIISDAVGVPLRAVSSGPTWADKHVLRHAGATP